VTSPNGTQAIDRAAQLLTQVVNGAEPVTFTELTAASGLAKSTTSRLLMALERHQLVRRDGDGRFWPGELFTRYAWRGTARTDLVAVAQPFLDRLGEQTGETVNLGVAGGAGGGIQYAGARHGGGSGTMVQQIAQVDSTYMIGGTNWVGLSCRCTAPRSARCCWPTARPSCRRGDWSSAQIRRSPAKPRCAPTWPPCGPAATR